MDFLGVELGIYTPHSPALGGSFVTSAKQLDLANIVAMPLEPGAGVRVGLGAASGGRGGGIPLVTSVAGSYLLRGATLGG